MREIAVTPSSFSASQNGVAFSDYKTVYFLTEKGTLWRWEAEEEVKSLVTARDCVLYSENDGVYVLGVNGKLIQKNMKLKTLFTPLQYWKVPQRWLRGQMREGSTFLTGK